MPDRKIISVPFSYQVAGVLPRCRNDETLTFFDSVPVEVRILSKSDAPVGARVISNGEVATEYRMLDGRPIRALHEFSNPQARHAAGREGQPITLETLEAVSTQVVSGQNVFWTSPPFDLPTGYLYQVKNDGPRRGDVHFRSIRWDGYEAAQAKASRTSERLCVVDGAVHVEVPEPIWWAGHSQNSGGRYWATTNLRDNTDKLRWTGELQPFRADRKDAAERMTKVMANSLKQARAKATEFEDFGLISWTFDDVGSVVTNTMGQFQTTLTNKAAGLAHMPRDFYGLMVDLREITDEAARANPAMVAEKFAAIASAARDIEGRAKELATEIRRIMRFVNWRLEHIEKLGAEADLDDLPALAAS